MVVTPSLTAITLSLVLRCTVTTWIGSGIFLVHDMIIEYLSVGDVTCGLVMRG